MIQRHCPELSFANPDTRVAVSGAGNVAQFTALKAIELGATVVSLSDSHGALIATAGGFTKADVEAIGALKLRGGRLSELVEGKQFEGQYAYHAGQRPWRLLEKVHIALPGATQNEVDGEDAEALVRAGCRIVAEGSNMGSTKEAVHVFEASRQRGGLWYAPGSASRVSPLAHRS
jgi:glutamate dehydrogenase (NADP+)